MAFDRPAIAIAHLYVKLAPASFDTHTHASKFLALGIFRRLRLINSQVPFPRLGVGIVRPERGISNPCPRGARGRDTLPPPR